MEMQTLRNIAFCLMLFSAHLFAQSKDPRRYAATGPVFEASAGYVFMSMTSPATSRLNLQGVDANGLLHFSPHWGGMLDFTLARSGNVPGTTHSDRVFSGLIGPVYYVMQHEKTSVFANALFGAAWVDSAVPVNPTTEFHGYETRFSYLFGAGVERSVTGPFSVRVSGGYQRTAFVDSKLAMVGQNNLRVSGALVYRFGSR
jgi:opacity protein-like surface antigen